MSFPIEEHNQYRSRKAFPSIGQAILLSVLLLIVTVLMSLIIFLVLSASGHEGSLLWQSAAKFLGYVIPFTVVILLATWLKTKVERSSAVFSFKPVPPIIYPAVLFIALSITLITEPVVELIPMPEFFVKIFEMALSDDVLSLLLIVLVAPILEELFFRGIILDGFLKKYAPWKAIFWSSFFFGLVHLNPWQFIPALALGLFIGWIYWKTRSLLPCIFIHVFVNFLGMLVFLNLKDVNATVQDMINQNFLYIMILITTVLISLFFINKLTGLFANTRFSDEET